MRPKVYVAGPYTKPEPVRNTRAAIHIANEIHRIGGSPYVPHLTMLWDLVAPREWDEWLDHDLEWIGACHALFRIKGESPGADKEVRHAEKLGIPVFHDLKSIESWIKGWVEMHVPRPAPVKTFLG